MKKQPQPKVRPGDAADDIELNGVWKDGKLVTWREAHPRP